MGSLTEFLKERAEKERSEHGDRKRVREDWVKAVNQLTDQMEKWLRQADQDQVLEIDVHGVEKREEGIGRYLVRALTVRLEAREVRVVPVARFVVAAPLHVTSLPTPPQGRVDITDGESRYELYRLMDTSEGRWVITRPREGLRGFDREAFEAAVQDLLG